MFSNDVTRTCLLIVQVSANGNVLRSEIVGAVKMRVYLSGMPELRLGLNDKVLFESTGSKSCVNTVVCLLQPVLHIYQASYGSWKTWKVMEFYNLESNGIVVKVLEIPGKRE